MENKIKIILADDHPLMRRGLRQVIETEPDLFVAAEAGDGVEALEEIERHAPDVAILDVDMPRSTGFDVLRRLGEKSGTISRVILLTVHDEPEFFNEAQRRGAAAYVLKDSAIEEIVLAIRAVAAGENFVSARLQQYLFRRSTLTETSALANLTRTERQILKLVAEYKTSQEIAEVLFVSLHTIKTHRRNISAKLGIEGSNRLMKFALENKTLL